MELLCGYCNFAEPFDMVPASFIINGQSVCSDHIDTATTDFGSSLYKLQQEQENG